jgi:hypothetical protein
MDSLESNSEDQHRDLLRTLSTLQQVGVDDVVMMASADDQFDESDGVTEEPDVADEDRNTALEWATAGRDATLSRTSMDKFDRMDFDRTGHRIERPIGPRTPTTFTLNSEWFPNGRTSIKAT